MIQFGTIKYGIQFRTSHKEKDRTRHHRGENSGSCSEEDAAIGATAALGGDDGTEAHMCPRCHEQFQRLPEYLHHKRLCDEKAMQMGEERMHSDPEDMVVSGDEEMDEPAGKRLELVRRHRQDAENNNSPDEGDGDGDGDGAESHSPPAGFPFPVPGHVALEALQNTKVAVAQFAATAMANNTDNEAALQELAVLQSTLFTLQHQQVFQLQLIQQLQKQLSLTRRKDGGPVTPPPLELKSPPAAGPSPSRVATPPKRRCPTRESTPVRQEPTAPPPAAQSIPSTHSQALNAKLDIISVPKPPTPTQSTQPMLPNHPPYSSISSSLAASIITNNDPPPSLNEPNTLEMLQRRAQEVLDNASQGLLANNLADELAFRKSGKMSPYDGKSGGRNEPFFKHRCRYCGKVFGSDSALQIHIRSHTGERPFKCNVCGSRFTTKGNLKVHFQRHTAKFPHVKMNPNPVPEHLDKYHPPLLAQLSPGPIPGMPPHPMQFPTGGPPPFPPGLPMYRPPHHDLMTPRHIGEKPLPPHPMFLLREEQDLPADLSKPPSVSPIRNSVDTKFKSEPHEEQNHRELQFEESGHLSPKREPEDQDHPDHEHETERFPSPSQYDDCSTDSKFSNEDMIERDSPHMKQDPDQPENLSMRGNTTCNICYKTFACHSALEIHYRSHTKERPFKCTVCDRGFSTKSSGGVCQCRARAPRRTSRPQHATALNAPWSPFAILGNMKQHMLTHKIRDMPQHGFDKSASGDESRDEESMMAEATRLEATRPEVGLKRSPPATDLPLPKRPTTGVPHAAPQQPHAAPPGPLPPPLSTKHLCGVCRKNFSSSSALQIHMRTHTGDKPFRCAVCQKAFTTKGNLKVHMGTHMWSSGASRRGRRMSLELPPRPPLEPHAAHDLLQRRPDLFYPYLPAPFLNGMQHKLNEISVIQQHAGQNNGLTSPGAKFPSLLGFGAFPGPPPVLSQPESPSSVASPPPMMHPNEREALMREMAERDRDAMLRDLAERDLAFREMSHDSAEAAMRELAERSRLLSENREMMLRAREAQTPDKEGLPRMWDLHYDRKTSQGSDKPGERVSPPGSLPLIANQSRSEGLTA